MADVNKVTLIGTVERVDRRTGATGASVLKIRLKTTSVRGRDADRKEYTTWHDVVCFGDLATANAGLSDGDRVYVDGELRTSSYEKDGEKRYSTEVSAYNVVRFGAQAPATEQKPAPAKAGNVPF